MKLKRSRGLWMATALTLWAFIGLVHLPLPEPEEVITGAR
jgi:hypothetical protein